MRSLFSHLVSKLGSKEAIDPITKEDSLWKIVNFFSQSIVQDISKSAENNHNSLNPRDVA
jgi:hypothetical protein